MPEATQERPAVVSVIFLKKNYSNISLCSVLAQGMGRFAVSFRMIKIS
jgi:hypothetical protein